MYSERRYLGEKSISRLFGIFNVRPLFFALSFVVSGILVCIFAEDLAPVCYCIFALFALYLYKFRLLSSKTFIVVLILLCCSLSAFSVTNRFAEIRKEGRGELTGMVLSSVPAENGYTLTLGSVEFRGKPCEGKVVTFSEKPFELGSVISAKGKLTPFSFDDFYGIRRICYKEYHSFSASSITYLYPDDLPFKENLLHTVRTYLTERTGEEGADFAMSILFGESEYLSSLSSYREVNLAHLFAVSGLHVGTLSSVIYFIFVKLLKRRRTAISTLAVLSAVLTFYAYLCSFSPSVIRAFLAVLIGALLAITRVPHDALSVWALSATIGLIVKPLWLFDVSFLLSYAAVLGIILTYSVFTRVFSRFTKNALTSSIALDLSVSVSVIPVSAYCFGKISLLSLPLSLLYIPLVSLLYVYVLLCLPFLAYSFSAYLLYPFKLAVAISDHYVYLFDALDLYVDVSFHFVALLCWFAALFLVSDICLLPKLRKFGAALCAVLSGTPFLLP